MQDLHIHMWPGKSDSPAEFMEKTRSAGVTGGAIMSLPVPKCDLFPESDLRWESRLEKLLEFTSQTPGFRPVYWIDPTDIDAKKQIAAAAEKGVAGYKIICTHFYPKDILPELHAVSETGKPVMFHSGILYSDAIASQYHRPVNFECLQKVPDLRFSLAHISWPWCTECVALFGQINSVQWRHAENHLTMFFDLTPGTPPLDRREALRKVYLSKLQVKHRVLWGTDNLTNNYKVDYAQYWQKLDRECFAEIQCDANKFVTPEVVNDYHDIWDLAAEDNFKAFFGEK